MGNYLRIPGETPFPALHPPRPRPHGTGFFFLVFLFLFCAVGYAFFKYAPSLGLTGEKKETMPPTFSLVPSHYGAEIGAPPTALKTEESGGAYEAL
jgi:hypothetical protein